MSRAKTLAAALAAALLGWLPGRLLFEETDRRLYDARLAMRRDAGWPADLVAVPVDEASLVEIGLWPWPRARLAELLRSVRDAGADTIVLDASLDKPTDDVAGDAALAAALHDVVIPVTYSRDAGFSTRGADLQPFLLPVAVPQAGWVFPSMIGLPRPLFATSALGVGQTVSYTQVDDRVRSHTPLLAIAGADGSLPSIALLGVLCQRRIDPRAVRATPDRLDVPGLPPIRLREGQMAIDFVPRGSKRLPSVAARDVLAGRAGDALRGRIALVYLASPVLPDRDATPMGPLTYGGEIVAWEIRTLEDGRTPRQVSRLLAWLLAVAPLLAACGWLARGAPARALAATGALALLYLGVAFALVPAEDLFLPVMTPLASIAACGGAIALEATRRLQEERGALQGLLQRAATIAPATPAVAAIGRPAPSPERAEDTRTTAGRQTAAGAAPVRISDRYRIVRPLGAGGMGAIFEAEDESLQRPVAIKVLHATDPNAYRRFRREALAVARINHPNVVQVYEVGSDSRGPFIAMELVRGGDLDAALQAGGPLEWRRASRIIASAARGLGAAHALGVVHRDVKPQNLLLTDAAGDGVKVADFGLAKLGAGGSLTAEGSYLGTIGYLAPEQAMGEDVGPAADVFSLGVTWYRLLAGRHPFHGTASELLKATIVQRVPDPRASVSDLPAPIAEVLLAMTSPDPMDRPRDGADVSARIEAALATAEAARARSG